MDAAAIFQVRLRAAWARLRFYIIQNCLISDVILTLLQKCFNTLSKIKKSLNIMLFFYLPALAFNSGPWPLPQSLAMALNLFSCPQPSIFIS